MVLTGIGLLLGERADAGRVRSGDARAEVEGRFAVPTDGAVAARVREAGGGLDEDAGTVARTVSGEGRSRAFAGGRSVPAAVLAELGERLVAVHGQSDQHRLLRAERQRQALDRLAGDAVAVPYARYRRLWEHLRSVESELAEITGRARERAQEADLLRLGVEEIAALDPKPREDDELRAEAARLSHAEALREAADLAHAALVGTEAGESGPDVLSLLVAARRAVDPQREHDAELADIAERVAEVATLVTDVAGDLAGYRAGVEGDPLRLAAVEERRAALATLTRKYGDSVEEVLGWAERSTVRLATLDTDDDRVTELTRARDALAVELAETGAELSGARASAATRFADAVSGELHALAMPHARLDVAVRALPVPGPHGHDEVELLLSPHPGSTAAPLSATASGGELSRVMLAIEVVFAGADPVDTMVFDEVDAGVGGKAAAEVGRRLARLSRTSQVLVVTHLPQVAAFADRQVVVEKSDDGRVSTAGLRIVDGEARVKELARMLAGLESSDTAAAHAGELLELAARERAAGKRPTTARKGRRTGSRDR
jgi:DNA repair protein RecN (Recombination protein N)